MDMLKKLQNRLEARRDKLTEKQLARRIKVFGALKAYYGAKMVLGSLLTVGGGAALIVSGLTGVAIPVWAGLSAIGFGATTIATSVASRRICTGIHDRYEHTRQEHRHAANDDTAPPAMPELQQTFNPTANAKMPVKKLSPLQPKGHAL